MIPTEMCYLGWQESLEQLKRLVEPQLPDEARRSAGSAAAWLKPGRNGPVEGRRASLQASRNSTSS